MKTATKPTVFVYRKAERGWWAVEAPEYDVWSQGRSIAAARANMVGALLDLMGESDLAGEPLDQMSAGRIVVELVA